MTMTNATQLNTGTCRIQFEPIRTNKRTDRIRKPEMNSARPRMNPDTPIANRSGMRKLDTDIHLRQIYPSQDHPENWPQYRMDIPQLESPARQTPQPCPLQMHSKAGNSALPAKTKQSRGSIKGSKREKRRKRQRCISVLVLGILLLCCLPSILKKELQPLSAAASERDLSVNPNQAAAKDEAWNLLLVNPWNYVPDGYSNQITLKRLSNGQAVDKRCYPELQQMMDDCRAAGLSPKICSSYRTLEKQDQLFQNKIQRLMEEGYSQKEAATKAAAEVAVPGTSEHHLGLAIDVVDESYQRLTSTQEDTAVQQWLMANSWQYGFILRYPKDKTSITGIIYEPWHYRYVGKKAAKAIYKQGICLEEYLEK